jgi:hypothetical protein
MPTRILLKTTIGSIENDWNVARFSLLTEHLRSLKDSSGSLLYEVVARDRAENASGDDVDLADLVGGAYGQLWLIGADETVPSPRATSSTSPASDDPEAERCSAAITRTSGPVSREQVLSVPHSIFTRPTRIPMSRAGVRTTSRHPLSAETVPESAAFARRQIVSLADRHSDRRDVDLCV